MQIFVKTLKGTHFEIEVKPDDTIADVKHAIEALKGENVYPADQQMLIHQGKVLNDETTLAENNVSERNFIVIMLRKAKSSSEVSAITSSPASQLPTTSSAPANPSILAPAPDSNPDLLYTGAPTSTVALIPMLTATPVADAYDEAASNLVAGNTLEQAIQRILDIGGGTWDRDTVVKAMRAAFNNPERAVEYLYSGIPEQAKDPPVAGPPAGEQEAATPPLTLAPQPVQPAFLSTGPNANPLNLFPQGLPTGGSNTGASNLDFLRNSPQFRALQRMVQANPQILQPMLLELSRQNPPIMRLIQDHQDEFLNLINESSEGGDNTLIDQLAAEMPQSIAVTPEENEAIERLEAMGFDRALVVEVFFACSKDEEMAANYLLDHIHEFEDEEH